MSLKIKFFLVSFLAFVLLGLVVILTFTIGVSNYNNKILKQYRNVLIEQKKSELKSVIDTAYSVLNPIIQTKSGIDLQEDLATKVKDLRFIKDNPDSYFYIHNPQGIIIAHGSTPEKVGSSEWELKNSKNQYIVRNIIKSSLEGDGFTQFDGYKPTQKAFFPKMTFSRVMQDHSGLNKYILTTGFYIDDVDTSVNLERKRLEKDFSSFLTGTILVVLVFSFIISLFVYFLISMQIRPLNTVVKHSEELSKNGGDLTLRLPVKSNDEIGKVAKSFNDFLGVLQGILAKVTKVSGELYTTSIEFEKLNKESQKDIDTQLDKVNVVATAMEEMSTTTAKIAIDAELSANEVNSCLSATKDGEEIAHETMNAISRLNTDTQLAIEQVDSLNKNTGQIYQIIATIQDIAEQTNLLALNAAIEAARAGEHGRGFAVVADEVRNLSQKTTNSVSEIENMITDFQNTTKETTSKIKLIEDSASTSVEKIKLLINKFTDISQAIDRILQMSIQIATSSEQQSLVSNDIARNMNEVKVIAASVQDLSKFTIAELTQSNLKIKFLNSEIDKFNI